MITIGNVLSNFPGTIFEFQSTDTGRAKDLAKLTAPWLLWIKKSCPVILLRNLSKTLVNGLSGYVCEVDDSEPVINFPSVNLVTRISKVKFTVYSQELNKDIAVREQYPLKLGFGITIRKAQGMTLNKDIAVREQHTLKLGFGITIRKAQGMTLTRFGITIHKAQGMTLTRFGITIHKAQGMTLTRFGITIH
ncbi:ATP-dependent DNA helicase PIF1-like [Mya arenaria]|uniref:ATP-dependent DNA helicase PIF1-like n=1 Tax=Mya arenaria TaxID=6604 RepID=UPI0022E13AF3|nr:ATP-dependent DNA helicase PIF1-like [Mya arenaria]